MTKEMCVVETLRREEKIVFCFCLKDIRLPLHNYLKKTLLCVCVFIDIFANILNFVINKSG